MLVFLTFSGIIVVCNKNSNTESTKEKLMTKSEVNETAKTDESDSINDYVSDDFETDDEFVDEYVVDSEEYYNRTSEILSRMDVTESKNLTSEKQTREDFAERGFSDVSIISRFDLKGNYNEKEISTNSNEKHPSYVAYYTTPSNNIWTIYETNGQFQAYPVSYTLKKSENNEKIVDVILSESESIYVHNAQKNQFFDVIPNGSDAIVKTVKHIDADYLNSLTDEDIDNL
ncbi:hypothetical protein [Acetitomaculum ruminis]|nr:hypothetical protein [Acetitomaculum ruminis]